jgi:hypothetical protein
MTATCAGLRDNSVKLRRQKPGCIAASRQRRRIFLRKAGNFSA